MRHLLFAALFLAGLLPNCKKEQIIIKTPEPIDTIVPIDTIKHIIDFGQSSVLKNSILWDVPYRAYYEYLTRKRFSFRASKQYSSGLRETAFITDIPLAVGRHSVRMVRSFGDFNNGVADGGYTMANYDEGIGNFYPDSTRNDNYIEVLRFDTITNQVEGRFQLFMGKDGGPSTVPDVPDSVFLTEGKFYLKLQ